jgi:cell fate (sporulation/competence/biofilm development) regulator YmcA (YheA/YmcA/DUF963 family)
MTTARLPNNTLGDLKRQHVLLRKLGCHTLAQQVAGRVQFLEQHIPAEPIVTPRQQVGIYKGGIR